MSLASGIEIGAGLAPGAASGLAPGAASGHDLRRYDAVLVRSMPPGSLEQVVFRMDALARLEAEGILVVNRPKTLETAIDKYLTIAHLHAAGIATPHTIVCQTYEQAMAGFELLDGDVVVKPIFGGEGRGVLRVTDREVAHRTFKTLTALGSVCYLQEFLPHNGFDLRLLKIGRQVLGVRRSNPLDWRTNVSRGAEVHPITVDQELRRLAEQSADAVGASMAGVDVIRRRDGKHFVLEVNAVPGWKGLAAALEVDVAAIVWDLLETLVRAREQTRPG